MVSLSLHLATATDLRDQLARTLHLGNCRTLWQGWECSSQSLLQDKGVRKAWPILTVVISIKGLAPGPLNHQSQIV